MTTVSVHIGDGRGETTKPVAEFGECVLYAPAASAGKDKFDTRWDEGVWLGIRMESRESFIGANEGVVKARDFRRKAENGGRWSVADFDKIAGALGAASWSKGRIRIEIEGPTTN